jgi:hypothetical protein
MLEMFRSTWFTSDRLRKWTADKEEKPADLFREGRRWSISGRYGEVSGPLKSKRVGCERREAQPSCI